MNQLAVLGASGHGKVVADCALAAGWSSVAFFDDAFPAKTQVGAWAIQGTSSDLLERLWDFDGIIVGIGDNLTRWRKQEMLRSAGANLATVIHPRAWVSPYAKIGSGSVIVGGAMVNVDVVVGEACIVNTGAVIDHDCVLGNGVHVSPGANLSGAVTVGDFSWIGVGSSVRQCVQIGPNVRVGAGAVVLNAVPDGATVVGCPATPLREC